MNPRKNKISQNNNGESGVSVKIEKINLLSDHVIVKPIIIKSSSNGLISPRQYEDKPEFGEVIAAGPDVPDQVKPGSIIMFGKYSTLSLVLDGVDYLMLRSEDISGYIK